MLLFGKLILASFKKEHVDSRIPLDAWCMEAEEAQWIGPKQVKDHYKSAVLSPNRIVFSLKEGLIKLAVKARYEKGVLLIEDVWAESKTQKRTAAVVQKQPV